MKAIAAGFYHSLILKTDTLFACGDNWFGQLGDNTILFPTAFAFTPVLVMSNVQSIAAGWNHSLMLKTDGSVWACGNNDYGQLGDGTTTERHSPVLVMSNVQDMAGGYGFSFFLKTDSTLWACGNNRLTPVQVMSDVKNMLAGGTSSMILMTDGTLLEDEKGSWVQVMSAPGIPLTDVQSMGVGREEFGQHNLVVKTDGTFWAWGNDLWGSLGNGLSPSCLYPMQIFIPDNDSLALTITAIGSGTTTPPVDSVIYVPYGTPTPINAVPNIGYNFSKWSVTSGSAFIVDPAYPVSPSTTVTLYIENATVQAEFAP